MSHIYDYSAYLSLNDPNQQDQDKRKRKFVNRPRAEDCLFAMLEMTQEDLQLLPSGSFFLAIDFTMATAYTSRDDIPGSDNLAPVVAEWVYRVPMVRPTTWKGNLRFAARQDDVKRTDEILHLFGPDKGGDDEGQEGRLHFLPTFFFKPNLSTQMINPHDRKTRRGTTPVNYETVGANAKGRFTLLYVGEPDPSSFGWKECARLCCDWSAAMLTLHGFGAKKLKGWGLARATAEVQLVAAEKAIPVARRPLDGLGTALLKELA